MIQRSYSNFVPNRVLKFVEGGKLCGTQGGLIGPVNLEILDVVEGYLDGWRENGKALSVQGVIRTWGFKENQISNKKRQRKFGNWHYCN